MKKKLMTILITSIVMLAGMGIFVWKMSDISNGLSGENKAKIKEEKDLLANQHGKAIDDVKQLDINNLYLFGRHKNVVTINYKSIKDVYNQSNSARAEENITNIKKKAKDYTPEDALWAYNPYGTNYCSMYVYFKTDGRCYCKYTISVKDRKIPDFTRTLIADGSGNVSTEHEYQLIGLVPGMRNYITLKLYNRKDQLSKSIVYAVDIPKSATQAKTRISTYDGRSRQEISNGLYTVFGNGRTTAQKSVKIVTQKVTKNGKKVTKRVKKTVTKKVRKNVIAMYDNSGVLRSEMPLEANVAKNIQIIYDNIVYPCSANKFTRINDLGQVTRIYQVNGYKQDGEFAYDGYGNIYFIASALGKKTSRNSRIMSLELETGKVSLALDFDNFLSEMYKKSGKKANWIDINSVQVCGTNKLIISSKSLSSIFKVSNVGSLLPKLDYIIADKDIWAKCKNLKKKVLKKYSKDDADESATADPSATDDTDSIESILNQGKKKPDPFRSQYGQNALTSNSSGTLITMLNNNAGKYAKKSNGKSYYYQFKVNESAKNYRVSEKKAFEKTSNNGNIIKGDNSYIYCCSDKGKFIETDSAGKLIKGFKTGGRPYRVYKNDWKNFWFY